MEELPTPKPWIVKATIFGLGVLALFSLVACRTIAEELPAQAVANVLRALAANAAFIGVMSGSKFGRWVTIAVLALCSVGACFGLYLGVQTLTSSPILRGLTLLLSAVLILWSYAFVFGKSARNYYTNLRATTEVRANA
jgi:uncharacterized membrane protein